MAVGNKIEKRGHITGFREEISRVAENSDDAFFTWFDSARDKDAAFIRGSWDFMVHIATQAAPYISLPEEKTAFEIGHGGGRILAAASRYFNRVIGIDIHDNNEKVAAELTKRGIDNFRLIQTEGSQIPLEDASCDFGYSFIVLQHVEWLTIFESYFREAHRVLKPGGIAVLYFGRKCLLSANRGLKILYWLDRCAERLLLREGYQEIPEKVNDINLIVSMHFAKRLARKIGFDILKDLVSHKKVPDGMALYGGQNGLVVRRR